MYVAEFSTSTSTKMPFSPNLSDALRDHLMGRGFQLSNGVFHYGFNTRSWVEATCNGANVKIVRASIELNSVVRKTVYDGPCQTAQDLAHILRIANI